MIKKEGNIMYKILLGTYTRDKSEGIYQVDLANNKLSNLSLYIKTDNPTYLAWGTNHQELIAVASEGELAGVKIFQEKDLKVKILSKQTAPCFVSYQNGNYYSAYYHEGKVEKYFNDELVAEMNYQKTAKSHFILPDENKLWVVNLGEDKIYWILEDEIITYQTKENSGPRHLVLGENDLVYVLTELSNEVLVLKKEAKQLTLRQTIQLEGEPTNQSAAIRLSSDKRYLYTSTRGDDFLTVFQVGEDGLLTKIQTISSYGKHPRDFALSPDDKFLVCANRDSNSLTLFEVDKSNGRLRLLEKDVYAPEVVAVLFY